MRSGIQYPTPEFFSSVFTKENPGILSIFPRRSYEEGLMSVFFTPDTVNELNVSKATYPDKTHLRVLKEFSDVIAMALHHIYCKSLNEGTLP